MKKSKENKIKYMIKKILPFLVLIVIIFSISVLMFPEIRESIRRYFVRLGIIVPLAVEKEYTYTISPPFSPGQVVGYYSNATDLAGNPSGSELQTFTVIWPIDTIGVTIQNESKIETTTIKKGRGYWVNVTIENMRSSAFSPMTIIQVKDPDNVVRQSVFFQVIPLNPGQVGSVGAWYPGSGTGSTGTYTAQAYVWTNWPEFGGFAIASVSQTYFDVVE